MHAATRALLPATFLPQPTGSRYIGVQYLDLFFAFFICTPETARQTLTVSLQYTRRMTDHFLPGVLTIQAGMRADRQCWIGGQGLEVNGPRLER